MFAVKLLPIALLTLTAACFPSTTPSRTISSPLSPRESCVYTCGSTCYWASDVSAALAKGSSLHQSGQTEGSDAYPHEYYDDEGFDFPVAGPYYEFPILNDYDVYAGGSPGADRVVFNGGGDLAGLITHTGASGDDFLECKSDD